MKIALTRLSLILAVTLVGCGGGPNESEVLGQVSQSLKQQIAWMDGTVHSVDFDGCDKTSERGIFECRFFADTEVNFYGLGGRSTDLVKVRFVERNGRWLQVE
ncbi:MAG: hypothetical protein JXQ97_02390 [Natronospirillum sp.]